MEYHLAPGNVLQNMYLKARLKKVAEPGMTFIEIGSGNGVISRILLEYGLTGYGYDLNSDACKINVRRNNDFIQSGKYQVFNENFLSSNVEKTDIVISSHVIEHLPDDQLEQYFVKCKEVLKQKAESRKQKAESRKQKAESRKQKAESRIISLVPSSMKYWGIEDETCGHYRRFEFHDFKDISERYNLYLVEMSGLTYPLSNLLFRLSNYLIGKSDSWKKELSKEDQTKISATGVKGIKFKSVYPWYFKYIINEITMYPFYLLQRLFRKKAESMVIYTEIQLK